MIWEVRSVYDHVDARSPGDIDAALYGGYRNLGIVHLLHWILEHRLDHRQQVADVDYGLPKSNKQP